MKLDQYQTACAIIRTLWMNALKETQLTFCNAVVDPVLLCGSDLSIETRVLSKIRALKLLF